MHACRYTRDCWLFPCMVVVELHTLRWKSHVRFDVRRTVQPILRNGRSKRGTPASGNDLSPVFVRFCATGGVNYFHRRAARPYLLSLHSTRTVAYAWSHFLLPKNIRWFTVSVLELFCQQTERFSIRDIRRLSILPGGVYLPTTFWHP